jgi:hypothetical protein
MRWHSGGGETVRDREISPFGEKVGRSARESGGVHLICCSEERLARENEGDGQDLGMAAGRIKQLGS